MLSLFPYNLLHETYKVTPETLKSIDNHSLGKVAPNFQTSKLNHHNVLAALICTS